MYWIHRKNHTNIKTEGYVGVTFDPDKRFRQHKGLARKNNQNHLYKAIRKYSDIEYKILCAGGFDYICDLEKKLRPVENIGWNILPGGDVARGYTVCEELVQDHAQKISKYTKIQALNILIDYFEKGMNQGQISKKYDLKKWSIWSIVSGNQKAYPDLEDVREILKDKRPFKSHQCGELPEDLYDEILIAREYGLSWQELENKFNIPSRTIRGYCFGELDYLKKFSCYRKLPKVLPKKYIYKDRELSLREWSKEIGIKTETLWARLKKGWSIEKTFETPVRK